VTGRRPGAARGRRPTPSEPRRDGPDPGAVLSRAVTRVDYDEFGLFHENAEEFGLPYDGPPTVRREAVDVAPGRRLSALVWGTGDPELVLLHGGAQNAHTWDTVALALDRPLVAVDLPGHGHSDDPARPRSLAQDAVDVAAAVRALAPRARAVVGMSLGGLTALALAAHDPALVRRLVLVDITPTVTAAKAAAITAFVDGPASFADFDEILARTIEHNPTRSVSSLRLGILHNAAQQADGSWVWRYARQNGPGGDHQIGPDFAGQWDTVSGLTVPLLLVRGMAAGSVVDDDDEAEVLRRQPDAEVARVDGAGHSVQGDQPVALARLIDQFAP
jgi:pimeloyl-ACP methyl ester carboxylesterase